MEEKKTDFTTRSFTRRKIYRRLKKKEREEKNWDKTGHLLRTSTAKKYASNSKVWKTSLSITNIPIKEGGYVSKTSNFDNLPEIELLEDAISKGFVLVKSENL
jgi:hypothetical protein